MKGDAAQRFDEWLVPDGAAALVIREYLVPVEGADGVLFPATFAASEDKTFRGGYNINEFPDGHSVCLVDSVGSQANRLEPIFLRAPYSGLVPQVEIIAGEVVVNLLEAGHRAGDAIARCSELRDELRAAFQSVLKGNALPLARIAPTSIVFGAWDSRDTQAKLPRLVASTIRAFDVQPLNRSAQYVPAVNYIDAGLLDDPEDKSTRDKYAERGFAHVPSSWSHGGVIAQGDIRRDATLHLSALRAVAGGDDEEATRKLQRYILGLALVALTHSPVGYLRQGCNLVRNPKKAVEVDLVYADGRREGVKISHEEALAFATAAARGFGLNLDRERGTPPDRRVEFKRELAVADITTENNGKKGRKSKKQKA